MAVIEVTKDGLVLTEVAPGVSVEAVRAATAAPFTVSPELKEIAL